MPRQGWGSGRRIAAALFVSAGLAFAAAAETPQTLSRTEAKVVARDALASGRPDVAGDIGVALIRMTPGDPEAHILVAAAARALGRFDLAAEGAAEAWRLASEIEGDGARRLRFDAAMIAADALARQGRYTSAQLWLRRADNLADDAERRAVVARTYRSVAAANPLSVRLRFSVRPSNNVNNGAETRIIEIGGRDFLIPDSGLKLGGVEAAADLSLSYRLAGSETSRWDALAEVYHRRVRLDDEAAETAPEVSDDDYEYTSVAVGLRHVGLFFAELGPTEVTGLVGQSWYGGERLSRWGEIDVVQRHGIGDRAELRYGLTARTENRFDNPANDAETLALSVDLRQGTETALSWSAGATVKNVWSDSGTVDQFSYGVRGGFGLGRVGPAIPSLSGSLEHRVFHKFGAAADGRRDTSAAVALTMTFPDASWYGFAPQVAVTARHTWSNVDIYDRNEIAVGLTAVSRF